MSQRFLLDGDVFEDAPRVDADLLSFSLKTPFSLAYKYLFL